MPASNNYSCHIRSLCFLSTLSDEYQNQENIFFLMKDGFYEQKTYYNIVHKFSKTNFNVSKNYY